jgi:hypothetical protein
MRCGHSSHHQTRPCRTLLSSPAPEWKELSQSRGSTWQSMRAAAIIICKLSNANGCMQPAAIWESGKMATSKSQEDRGVRWQSKGLKHPSMWLRTHPKRQEQSYLFASCLLIDRFPCDPMFFFFFNITGT